MSTTPSPSLLRLRVSPDAERVIRGGHPWIFGDSIVESNRVGEIGDLAVVYDRQNKFLALGFYDPLSPIRFRVLHAGKPLRVDDAWWRERLRKAKALREPHFNEAKTNAWRWIHGENDGFPGLVLDRYADVLVLKLYSAVWLPRLNELLEWIQSEFAASAIVLRLSRNIQPIAAERWGITEGCRVGQTENLVVFRENGIAFEAEVIRGQKTGFYLDQRDNRARIEDLAKGREVLNAFSFSGGFSLYATRGGAARVTDLDISAHALESSQRNFALNPWAARTPHEFLQDDAMKWLAEGPRRSFDLIICDPPSLARREADRAQAIRAYTRLTESCLRRVRRGGVLVAASCSAHVSENEFYGAVEKAADAQGRCSLLWSEGHAPDHPATFPEAKYLKCVAISVG